MARLVMKFGGTSVATVERIKNAARHVKREFDAGNQVAVVISAMSGKTNELVAWCKEAAPVYDQAEYDTVVASGESMSRPARQQSGASMKPRRCTICPP